MRSQRIGFLEQSDIRRMTRECKVVDGINLGQGICDLPTPAEVLEETSAAVLNDESIYTVSEGAGALREAIGDKMAAYNGLDGVDPHEDVVVTVGATGAFACTIQGLFDPGDELIVFEPFYGYHLNTMRVGGVEPNFVTLEPPEWSVTRQALEAAITDKTRGILVNAPTNPSGKVFSSDQLLTIAEVCREHDLTAVADEIYEYIVYDGHDHVSLASLPGMYERTVTISGFSKTFSITGWRLGYTVAPKQYSEAIGLVNDLFYVCAPAPLQHGVARGMAQLESSYFVEMAAGYQAKRDMFCQGLSAAGLTPYVPDGAYYVLADLSALVGPSRRCDNARQAAMHILRDAGVASVPGSAFYRSQAGETLTRFCYAKDWDVLEQAVDQLQSLTI